MGYDIGPKIGIEGEKEFKEALKQVNTSLKTLGTEMKAVTSAYDKNDHSATALTAKNKVLNKQISEQKSKLNQLKFGLDAAKNKYGENNEVTQKWQQSVNRATAELNKMERELRDNDTALKNVKRGFDDAGNKLDEFGNVVEKTEKKTSRLGEIFKGAFWAGLATRAVSAVTNKIKEFARSAIDAGDRIGTMSEKIGLSTDRLQELEYAGTRLDVSVDTVTGSMSKLVRNMNTARAGSKLQTEAFKKLGIEIKKSDGSLRDANTVFGEAVDALGKVHNETERDAIAMQLFGKSAQDLNPLIKAGSKELERLSAEAHTAGAVMSEETIEALDNFDETIEQAKLSAKVFVGEALAGIIKDGQTATETMDDLQDSLADNGNIQTLIDKYQRLNTQLSSGSLSAEEVKQKTKELEQAKQDLIQASNGVVTAFDIENGTFDQQVKVLETTTQAEKDYLKHKLVAQIIENSGESAIKKSAKATEEYASAKEQLNIATEKKIKNDKREQNGKRRLTPIEADEKAIEYRQRQILKAGNALAEVNKSAASAEVALKSLIDNGLMTASDAASIFAGYGIDVNGVLENTGNVAKDTIPEIQAMKEQIDALNVEYEAVYNSAYESAMGQFDLWDSVGGVVATSTSEIISNLESQAQYFNDYGDNLKALTDRVVTDASGMEVDTSKLVASLQDGSTQSAAILAGLATATDEEIANVVKAMNGVENGAANFADATARVETDYKERWKNIVENTVSSVKDMDKSEDAKQSGIRTIRGYINGINSQSSLLNLTMTRAAQSALNAWKAQFDEHSPSREMMKSGENALLGNIAGIENMKDRLNKAYAEIAEQAMAPFSIALPPMAAVSQITRTNFDADNNFAAVSKPNKVESPINQTVVINSPTPLTPSQIARESKNAIRRLAWA